jgi:hypothetical protein
VSLAGRPQDREELQLFGRHVIKDSFLSHCCSEVAGSGNDAQGRIRTTETRIMILVVVPTEKLFAEG